MSKVGLAYRRWRARHKMVLRSVFPWWVYFLGLALFAAVIAIVCWNVYSLGGNSAGYNREELQGLVHSLQEKNKKLEEELAKVQAVANVADTRSTVANSTQQNLVREIDRLTARNLSLSEDLALFERMVSSGSKSPISIYRFRLEPSIEQGKYYYQMLLATSDLQGQESFNGQMKLQADLLDAEGRSVKMNWPKADALVDDKYKISVKRFLRVSQFIEVPQNLKLTKLTVQILREGVLVATEIATYSKGEKNVF